MGQRGGMNKKRGLELRIMRREDNLNNAKERKKNPNTQFLKDNPNFFDNEIQRLELEIKDLKEEYNEKYLDGAKLYELPSNLRYVVIGYKNKLNKSIWYQILAEFINRKNAKGFMLSAKGYDCYSLFDKEINTVIDDRGKINLYSITPSPEKTK